MAGVKLIVAISLSVLLFALTLWWAELTYANAVAITLVPASDPVQTGILVARRDQYSTLAIISFAVFVVFASWSVRLIFRRRRSRHTDAALR
jgi:hypothetical protein